MTEVQTHNLTPRAFTGEWTDAHDLARDMDEPVFVPCVVHCDDRGWSIMNAMTGVLSEHGQVNYSLQHPGVVKAWHCHARQTDFWMPLLGHVKAGVHRERDGVSWTIVIGDRRPGVLVIPPGLWHGVATVGAEPAGLLYYVTTAYDPDAPDELRRAWDSVAGFDWGVEQR